MAPLLGQTTPSNIDAIIDALVLAFSVDPLARWVYSSPQQYLKSFPEFVRLFGRNAFETGTAHSIADYAGAALWLTPGSHADDQSLAALLQRTASPALETVLAVFEQMSHYHPKEPHWYLALLGVEPTQQRKGYGSALMKPVLLECDLDRTLAYLESSNLDYVKLSELSTQN